MSLSKKIRFEVFKRDSFQCGYCGKTPPGVVLEVDHIHPKSKGGENDMDNLITACFDCNRGKSNGLLNQVPSPLAENMEALKEKEAQIKEYRKFIKGIERRVTKDIDDIADIYSLAYSKWHLTDRFKAVSIKKFLSLLPKHEVIDSLNIAISRFPDDSTNVIKYFCGICWSKIRGDE